MLVTSTRDFPTAWLLVFLLPFVFPFAVGAVVAVGAAVVTILEGTVALPTFLQSGGAQPALHMHVPLLVQVPWPLQSPGHGLVLICETGTHLWLRQAFPV